VYWEDTDAGGIVFYANHLRFFERARTEWLRHLGLGQQALKDLHSGMFVVSQVDIRYLRPARLDDRLRVTAQLTQAGRASLDLHQQAWLLPPEQAPQAAPVLLCEASVRVGWVDAVSLRPQRIPACVLDLLSAHQPG
jgi:acyl-CoA thioester hydrolase